MALGSESAPFFGAAGAAGGGATGYTIERSLRFNSADTAYLNRTPSSAGNRKTFTWAAWVKLSKISATGNFFVAYNGSFDDTEYVQFYYAANSKISLAGTTGWFTSDALFRDPSAWYHLMLVVDTTLSTADDRVKVYSNGVRVAKETGSNPTQNYEFPINRAVPHYISTYNGSAEPFDGYLADVHFIDGQALAPTDFGEFDANGVWQPIAYAGTYGTNGFHLDFSDNSTAAALGTDTSGNGNDWTVNNISIGTPYYRNQITGTVQENSTGLTGPDYNHLLFNGSSSAPYVRANPDGTVTWTPETSYTGVTDIALYTWYPSGNTALGTLFYVNGSLVTPTSKATNGWTVLPIPSGGTVTSVGFGTNGSDYVYVSQIRINNVVITEDAAGNDSLFDSPTNGTQTDTGAGGEVSGNYATLNPLKKGSMTLSNGNLDIVSTGSYALALGTIGVSSGKWYFESTINNSDTSNAIGIAKDGADVSTYPGANDSLSWVYLLDGRKVNGSTRSSYGDSYASGDVIGVALDADGGNLYFYKNGVVQNSGTAAFTGLTSGPYFPCVADDSNVGQIDQSLNFGQRAFAYSAPSGYKALCTANLDDPTIADGSTAMDVRSGLTAQFTINDLAFEPGLVVGKSTSDNEYWIVADKLRNFVGGLRWNDTNAEGSGNAITNVGATGYQSDSLWFSTSRTYVTFNWDAGTSTVPNTDGSITSSVRTNPSAGFSIVSYTGNGTAGATIGHGLGVQPQMVIYKNRDSATDWIVGHVGADLLNAPDQKRLILNGTQAAADDGGSYFNDTNPTSSVITLGNHQNVNENTKKHVGYFFAPVEGYSAFGSYTGNGSTTDNTFVYTGMRPRFVLLKRSDSTGNWVIWDAVRNAYNVANSILLPNTSAAEYSPDAKIDILSNGFKIRDNSSDSGTNGATYIYAAFAENPFKTARAR